MAPPRSQICDYDDENQSSSQAQNSRRKIKLTQIDKDEAVTNFIRYVLNMMGSKGVIRKSEIVKHVLDNSGRSFDDIRKAAKKVLIEVYGLELFEVPNSSTNKQYIVVNTEKRLLPPLQAEERSQQALLLLILSHIFMSGGSASEPSIFNFLEKINISVENDSENNHFSNVKHLIQNEFPRMLYLTRSENEEPSSSTQQAQSQRTEVRQWSWGARAHKEITKEAVLSFVAKVYKRDMSTWTSLYKQVRREQQEAEAN